ncbi:MAG: septum formation family protein, partial [Acidimicrobiales bacterium]
TMTSRPVEESSTTTTVVLAAVGRPSLGECRGPITQEIFEADSDPRKPIGCDQPHGAETVMVLDLPAPVADLAFSTAQLLGDGADRLPPDALAAFGSLLDQCDVALNEHTGAPVIPPTGEFNARGSQLAVAWFIPTGKQWTDGARWLRCDAIINPAGRAGEFAYAGALEGVQQPGVPIPMELRYCLDANNDGVACTQPHKLERMSVLYSADSQLDPTAVDAPDPWIRLAQPLTLQMCDSSVLQLLGGHRDDVLLASNFPNLGEAQQQWAEEARLRIDCYAGVQDGQLIGTLQDIGPNPLPLG